jgi:hypothetical protein
MHSSYAHRAQQQSVCHECIAQRGKYLYIMGAALLLLNSCATLFNTKYTELTVSGADTAAQFCTYSDTTVWYSTPYKLKVLRSKSDLLLLARNHHMQKALNFRSRQSGAFLIGNLVSSGWMLGLGYAVDLGNDNRYTYPAKITINLADTSSTPVRMYVRNTRARTGLQLLSISIPEGNSLQIYNGTSRSSTFGFLGIALGADYYIRPYTMLTASAGTLTDFIAPIPVPIDRWGPFKRLAAQYVSAELRREHGNFIAGIGTHYFHSKFLERTSPLPIPTWQDTLVNKQLQSNAGPIASLSYNVLSNVALSIKYMPSVVRWQGAQLAWDYTHLLFLEAKVTIDLRPRMIQIAN